MSTFEHLFVDPNAGDLAEAVEAVVGALDLQMLRDPRRSGPHLYSMAPRPDIGPVGGEFEVNVYGDMGPEDPADVTELDVSIYDDMPIVWSLWAPTDGDLGEQGRRARGIFDLVVERLGWSAMLVHDFDTLVATYDPERGVRNFPPGTPADGTGRHLWE